MSTRKQKAVTVAPITVKGEIELLESKYELTFNTYAVEIFARKLNEHNLQGELGVANSAVVIYAGIAATDFLNDKKPSLSFNQVYQAVEEMMFDDKQAQTLANAIAQFISCRAAQTIVSKSK